MYVGNGVGVPAALMNFAITLNRVLPGFRTVPFGSFADTVTYTSVGALPCFAVIAGIYATLKICSEWPRKSAVSVNTSL